MCGIVGAVAQRNIVPTLVEGLRRLEYRGYDSCGVAVHADGELKRLRSVARVAELNHQVESLSSFLGIAHTRWATHGAPTTANAHPHVSAGPGVPKGGVTRRARVAVVHNGIIENYEGLRDELKSSGYTFESQTDTEVIAHLIDHHYQGDLFEAVQAAVRELEGAYAIAVFCREEPHRVIGARSGSPLVIGVGMNENFLASDALALAGVTDRYIYLEEGDVADLQLGRVWLVDRHGQPVQRTARTLSAFSNAVELGPYRHFMQKEIFEQPKAIADTLDQAIALDPLLFGEKADDVLQGIDRVLILACGTSYYAGCVARSWIESIAQVPTEVEIASEYRSRISVPNPATLVVVVSQSGETADTLAALRHARSLGMTYTLAVCNVATSAIMRETRLQFLTRAGVEVGVASTKAFTTQLVALYLLATTLAKIKGRLNAAHERDVVRSLRHLPAAVQSVLALEPNVIAWSDVFARKENALFLGRGMHFPIAMEGALKLKEISYIHAEAYPAGELKHGPLALVDADMPVITVAPNNDLLEKLKSNLMEVRARGGELIVFADPEAGLKDDDGVTVITMPRHVTYFQAPAVYTIPLQLLAYHVAILKGTDVDQPRNLAKSVTVE